MPEAASAAVLPSCTALWASMGWPTTSPMAKMCGTLVRSCLSTGMKPRSSTITPAFSAPITLPLGFLPTATRMRSKVSVAGRDAALEADDQAFGLGLDLGHLGLEEDVLVLLADPLVQRRDQVLVGTRDDLVHQLDDGHLGTQRVVDRRHLQPDDPAAHDQEPLGHAAELEGAGGVDHPRVGVRDERQGHGLGAGGDDRLLEADGLLAALGVLDLELVERGEPADALRRP